jgi:hypothetical protein
MLIFTNLNKEGCSSNLDYLKLSQRFHRDGGKPRNAMLRWPVAGLSGYLLTTDNVIKYTGLCNIYSKVKTKKSFLTTASSTLPNLSSHEIQSPFTHSKRKQNFKTCTLHWFCDSNNAAPTHVKKSTFTCKIRCQFFILQRGALTIHNVNDLQCYKLFWKNQNLISLGN